MSYHHGMAIDRWLRIELRHLLALAAVAEEGSFSAAGDRLGYVQSAVSHQIAALEAIVGARLVERSRGQKPVALTPDGQLLYEHARAIVARVRAADAELSDTRDGSTLDIGSFQAISSRIVVPVLRRLDPRLRIRLVEQTTEHGLLDRLAEGELDAVFTEGPLPSGPFESVFLFEDPYVLVAPRSLDVDGPITLKEVAKLPLVGHSIERPRLQQHLELRGLEPNYVVSSDVNTTIQALVRSGVACAVVPAFSVDATDEEIVVLPLEPVDAVEPRRVLLAWNSERVDTKPVAEFLEATLAVCEERMTKSP